ncbi:hypothetical protein [Corynebacterium sp. MSK195]|uniref:hypothetical protein n=1 Tax=Corynebacterium sp. MSK195 TaxID=3050216 RepID=UPI00254C8A10|nr:hypothetical protein [Corynebacterium sp. MSK195]MDK8669974.1 hypothetical protein [Corynebacterium sp. MSK195]
MKTSSLVSGLIAGAILGLMLWLGSGMFWLFLAGLAIGIAAAPLLKLAADPSRSRKRRDSSFRD